MKKILFLSFVLWSVSCADVSEKEGFSVADETAVKDLHEQYRQAWLKNDSTAVADLFTPDGALMPPNNKGDIIKGRQPIIDYWFPRADTVYMITQFEINIAETKGDGNLAFSQGTSTVHWNTVTKGKVLASASSKSDFLTISRKINGNWKIYRQVWNNKPVQ